MDGHYLADLCVQSEKNKGRLCESVIITEVDFGRLLETVFSRQCLTDTANAAN